MIFVVIVGVALFWTFGAIVLRAFDWAPAAILCAECLR